MDIERKKNMNTKNREEFENILANQANRLANNNTLSSESLRTIVKEDCVNA